MKKSTFFSLVVLYGAATIGHADEVIGRAPNNLIGQSLGGWSGFLAGGALAGPVGALAVGAAGIWLGSELQESTNLSEQAYLVKQRSGTIIQVRSPNEHWQTGDQVIIKGRRLHPLKPETTLFKEQETLTVSDTGGQL